MTPDMRFRRGLLTFAALTTALFVTLVSTYPLHRTHGQGEQFVSTYTYDPTSGQLTLQLTITDPSVIPVLSIGIDHSSVNIQSLIQAPPGCTADPLSNIFFVDCPSPQLQLGVAYTFVFQVAAGSNVSGPLQWIATHIGGNLAQIFTFTSQPAAAPTPTFTPTPTATPTPIPPTATATATATATPTSTLTPTPTATPPPPALAIDAGNPLHVGHTVTMRVWVRNKETKSPVEGAEVTLNGRSVGIGRIRHAPTDGRGAAVFRRVRPSRTGVLHVSAAKKGFRASTARVQVRP